MVIEEAWPLNRIRLTDRPRETRLSISLALTEFRNQEDRKFDNSKRNNVGASLKSSPCRSAGSGGSDMAKPATIKIRLNSTAGTGHFYVTKKNARTMTEKMKIRKFDPVARKHVEYKEGKIK